MPTESAETIQHGIKRISPANLLQPDDFPSRSQVSKPVHVEKWVRECWKPQLNPTVPKDVAFLFEIARGAMIYGMFFLPLVRLGMEEGFRVLEAGVRHRCKDLGLAKPKSAKPHAFPDKPYKDLVMALHKAGKISEKDLSSWLSMVFLRNSSSHRTSAVIDRRHGAVGQLSYIAQLLNELFK